MNRHDRTLVAAAPGAGLDVGLFAQALLHFERVSVLVPDARALAPLLEWFVAPGEIETLLLYLRDGVVDFVDTAPETPDAFRERVLDDPLIAALMKGQYRHARLKSFTAGHVRPVTLPAGIDGGPEQALHVARALSSDLCVTAEEGERTREVLQGMLGTTVQRFDAEVRFPAVRSQVCSGRMTMREVIDLRRRARPLRAWLQAPDRGALSDYVALHEAFGRESALAVPWRLSMFGLLDAPPATAGTDHAWQPVIFAMP